MSQKQYKPHYLQLKKKWLERHKELEAQIVDKHRSALEWLNKTQAHRVVGSVAGLIMMANAHGVHAASLPPQMLPSPDQSLANKVVQKVDKKALLSQALQAHLPQEVQPLTAEQESALGEKLSKAFDMKVSAELQGKRLNRNYGLIGAEQHLMRYPGDTMDTHLHTAEDQKFARSGMAGGRGAWGYFVQPGETLTQDVIDREKYYIAVPTFMSPGYNDNVNEYYKFFKFRKMLVVNPENQKAMVTVIGDSGPAPFTGKHLGGSPEVMSYLERVDGAQKGPVLYFFIDDPENKIPLGPITL